MTTASTVEMAQNFGFGEYVSAGRIADMTTEEGGKGE